MNKIQNVIFALFIAILAVGAVSLSAGDLNASTIIKPKVIKSTTLKFCPDYPEVIFQMNTSAGYRGARGIKEYENFNQLAEALKNELDANNGETRCGYRIYAFPDKKNIKAYQSFACSDTEIKVNKNNNQYESISCGLNDWESTSANIYIYNDENADTDPEGNKMVGHSEFRLVKGKFNNINNSIQAYYVERSK